MVRPRFALGKRTGRPSRSGPAGDDDDRAHHRLVGRALGSTPAPGQLLCRRLLLDSRAALAAALSLLVIVGLAPCLGPAPPPEARRPRQVRRRSPFPASPSSSTVSAIRTCALAHALATRPRPGSLGYADGHQKTQRLYPCPAQPDLNAEPEPGAHGATQREILQSYFPPRTYRRRADGPPAGRRRASPPRCDSGKRGTSCASSVLPGTLCTTENTSI